MKMRFTENFESATVLLNSYLKYGSNFKRYGKGSGVTTAISYWIDQNIINEIRYESVP